MRAASVSSPAALQARSNFAALMATLLLERAVV